MFEFEGSEAAKQKRLLEELTTHPGWIMLRSMVESNARERADKILYVCTEDAGGPIRLEFAKGEITGMLFVLNLPQAFIEDLEIDIRRRKEELEAEANSERGEE